MRIAYSRIFAIVRHCSRSRRYIGDTVWGCCMSAAATPTAAIVSAPLDEAIAEFFDYLFDQRDGWACLGWLDGDPRLGDIDAKHQEWYAWPENRETLIRRAAWHASQGHNLYVRQTLFSKRS